MKIEWTIRQGPDTISIRDYLIDRHLLSGFFFSKLCFITGKPQSQYHLSAEEEKLAILCCQAKVTKYAKKILPATPNSSHARFATIAKVANENNKRHILFRDHSSVHSSTIKKLTLSYKYSHVYHFAI